MARFAEAQEVLEEEAEAKANKALEEIKRKEVELVEIYDKADKVLIGFLTIQEHPKQVEADYLIRDAYILPSYRHRGNMNRTVSRYVHMHPGRYALKIDETNVYGYRFWHQMFSDIMFYDESFAYPDGSEEEQKEDKGIWYVYTPHRLAKRREADDVKEE